MEPRKRGDLTFELTFGTILLIVLALVFVWKAIT